MGDGGLGRRGDGAWLGKGKGKGLLWCRHEEIMLRGGRREGYGVRKTDEGCRFIRRSFVFSSIHH